MKHEEPEQTDTKVQPEEVESESKQESPIAQKKNMQVCYIDDEIDANDKVAGVDGDDGLDALGGFGFGFNYEAAEVEVGLAFANELPDGVNIDNISMSDINDLGGSVGKLSLSAGNANTGS
eukprot:CAMPEP_0201567240 /NCGR_PEP_ID=MMETSP0190_2-20130828/7647_1 /ASSEMBLY_ACC=CAM_ASM_000263 /TAXON_ID=37353 /ORGANISM="Rosalina sp." /LENGTH=120 /DNA_ID=CAMNT_0047986997 /DNA_START=1704 /DNA_END=2066 /DNA_ORIENTATION=-